MIQDKKQKMKIKTPRAKIYLALFCTLGIIFASGCKGMDALLGEEDATEEQPQMETENVTNPLITQKMIEKAETFWENEFRWAALYNEKENTYQIIGVLNEEQTQPEEGEIYLMLACSSEDDICECAKDITNWMYQALEEKDFLTKDGQAAKAVAKIYIQRYAFEETSIFPVELAAMPEWIEKNTWEENCTKVEDKIRESAKQADVRWDDEEEVAQENVNEDETLAKEFMMNYQGDYEKECLVGDGTIRYRMLTVDAACGSRAYGLIKSVDAGKSWDVVTLDPFNQTLGMGIDFVFLDEEFGFATLARNAGNSADMYVTRDGGESYKPVSVEKYYVPLTEDYYFMAYDTPGMPYEENGKLYLLCGQGADGDYAGGDQAAMALYESKDNGDSFSFVEMKEAD